jgi:histidinol-phosphatase
MDQSPFLNVALEAAQAAADVIKPYYRESFEVRLKEDQSPVTIADLEAEKTIKGIIQKAFPDHGFYGEETGKTNPDAEYTWLVDPIDGTKSFVRGYGFFSTQIALMHGSEFILGVSNAPAFHELAYAERGHGAFLNGWPVHVSKIASLKEATLSMGNILTLSRDARWRGLARLVQGVNRTRGYGDFYHYHLLAAGRLDVVLESDVNILDIAALSVIVNEAGGMFTDLDGRALDLDTTSVLACNSQAVHAEVCEILEQTRTS